jgi:tRNA (guanosine-2'-O-)-methyltransferase
MMMETWLIAPLYPCAQGFTIGGPFVTVRKMDAIEDLDFTRARLSFSDRLTVGSMQVSCEQIIETLGPMLTSERQARLEQVVQMRTRHMVPVLENIYDRGNVSAVMRSAEAFGFLSLHLIDLPGAKFKAANRVTRGAEKWLDVRLHPSPESSVQELRARGYQIWATDLNTEHSIDDLDWSKPTAVVLGNEKSGVSPAMCALADGRFRLPMLGFSQSFNISVAAALVFYRAHLELRNLGPETRLAANERLQVLAEYYLRCFDNPEALLRNRLR